MNRETLRTMGTERKAALQQTRLKHADFHPYVKENKNRLD